MTVGLDVDTLKMTMQAIDEFAERYLPNERLLELDHEDRCPEETVRRMCGEELGVQMVFIPEEFSGMGGGAFDVYRVCEHIAGIDLGVATSVLATQLGSDPIVVGATDAQKKKWLTRIAEDGILFAYGATEPEAGSDLGALKTTATRVEQDGQIVGYKINGRKQWISNGAIADAWTILANTAAGPTWFVLGKENGEMLKGFSAAKPEDKHGIRLSNTSALFLDDVYVDASEMIGGVEGQGLWQAQQVFGYTRLMVAAFGLGGGWSAMKRAIQYSTERVVAGSPLSMKQGYTHKLIVPHVARLEAARSHIEEVATRLDADPHAGLNTEGAISKYMATEAGNDAAEASIQAFGGYGYTREYMVEKVKRDVRITTIYEGTSEIMEMTIARDRWQEHLKTRGAYYHQLAGEMESLAAATPGVGADVAALGLHALAELFEVFRAQRLTRHQHILFRMGELIAYAETAASFAKRAGRAKSGQVHPKSDDRFTADGLAAVSRVFVREAARKVVNDGLAYVRGANGANDAQLDTLSQAMRLPQIQRAQSGLIADMDAVADAIYGRTTAR
jgi:alkylation response protein AidB-like acyl-CoA dehydrogenase